MRHRLRVIRAHALGWIAFARLARAIAAGRVDEVWVGESNAAFFAMGRLPPMSLGTADGRRWAWHLGPRLMFSIARDGFPGAVRRAVRMLRFVPRTREVTWFFNVGEIDLRCHLVTEFGGTRAVVVVPVPPAVEAFIHESFPVVGTLEERLAAHRLLRRRITEAVSAARPEPRLAVLDMTERLSDDAGYFRPELTVDGVHPSEAGRLEARLEVAQLLERA